MERKIKAGDVFKTNRGCSFTIVAYTSHRSILIEFNDAHKHRMTITARSLNSGYIKNPYYPSVRNRGFIGVGKFKAYRHGKVTDEYKKWSSMFRRCYSEVDSKDRSHYGDCEIHEDWFNFQNFASWLTTNKHYKPEYQLDKDLLALGGKIYSPDVCCLVPTQINNILLDCKSKKKPLPIGAKKDKRSGKFIAAMSVNAKNTYIGGFDTVDQAHKSYVKAKEAHVKQVANEWRGRIDERVYEALMSWRVAS